MIVLCALALLAIADVDRFAPADASAFLVADDARATSGAFALVSWAKDPLVLRDAAGVVVKSVISQQLTSTAGASVALGNFALSVRAAGFVDAIDHGTALSFASPRVAAKLALVDAQGFTLGARGAVDGPRDTALQGIDVEPAVLFGFHNDVVNAGADVGVRIGSTVAVPWALGVSVPLGDVVSLGGDVYGSVAPGHTPVEAALACRAQLGVVGLVAGVGGGLVADVGTPSLRVFGGVRVAFGEPSVDAPGAVSATAGPDVARSAPDTGDNGDGDARDDALLAVADAPVHSAGVVIDGGHIALGDDVVLFDVDSAVLIPTAHAVLDDVARVLAEHPEVTHIVIEGHADAQGGSEHNQKLSHWRAWTVRHYLVAAGVSASRLSITAFGASLPVAPNNTQAGRRQNRRVELRIVDGGAQ